MSRPTDLQKRIATGYGSPMLGTRWKLETPEELYEMLTYTELLRALRLQMLETHKGQSFAVRIEREDY